MDYPNVTYDASVRNGPGELYARVRTATDYLPQVLGEHFTAATIKWAAGDETLADFTLSISMPAWAVAAAHPVFADDLTSAARTKSVLYAAWGVVLKEYSHLLLKALRASWEPATAG